MRHILVVDDDANIIQGLEQILKNNFAQHFLVHTAQDGIEALQLMQQYPVHLVITDIKMPGLDGIGLLEFIKNHELACYVIMLSGFDDYALIRNALRTGAYDYLLKPIHIAEFVQMLQQLLPLLPQGTQPHLFQLPAIHAEAALEHQFFDLPSATLASRDELYQLLQQAAAALLKPHALLVQELLTEFFDRVNGGAFSEEELRQTLAQFVYTLMEKSPSYISIIAASKLTHHDIMISIKNLPTLSQMKSSFCQTIQYYVELLVQADQQADQKLVQQVKEYIEGHFHQEILLGDMAQCFHLHPNYLSTLFKNQTGSTFRDYLRNLRIEKAKQLIREGSNKLCAIAVLVGYQDSSHFNRAFKEVTGITPSTFRKRI